MRYWKRTGVATLLALAACGSGGGSGGKALGSAPEARTSSSVSGSTSTIDTTSTTTVDPQTAVDTAALTISDFPAGWATDNAVVQDSSTDKGFCGKPSSKSAARVVAERRVAFAQNPNAGPLVQDWVILYGANTDASLVSATTRRAATSCTSWSSDGQPATIDQLSFPAKGDELQAYRVTVSGTSLDFVIVRLGRAVVQLTSLGLTPDELTHYVDRAIAKERAAGLG